MNRALRLVRFGSANTFFRAYFAGNLDVAKGTGPVSYGCGSARYVADNESLARKIDSDVAAYAGLRVAKNLLTYSEDFSNAVWKNQGNAIITGSPGNQIYSLAVAILRAIYQEVYLVGTGTLTVELTALVDTQITLRIKDIQSVNSIVKNITVLQGRQKISISAANIVYGLLGYRGTAFIYDSSGQVGNRFILHGMQLEDVTGKASQIPSEYVPTTTAVVTKWFSYANPHSVDGNGVVTDSGVRTPLVGKGLTFETGSTNLFSGFGVPRADAYGSTLTSGTAVKGKIYEIVARVSLDWGAVATLVSGTANTVGARYLITGTLTFAATETGKECIDYVGTKAYHDGTAWQNPITGMTISSADTSPVLSIVNDQTALEAMTVDQLDRVVNGWKAYDVTTGVTNEAVVTYSGAMAAVPTSISEYIRVLSGSCVLSDSSGTYTVTPTGTACTRYKKENFTPTAGATMKLTVAASSQVRFLLPQVESLPFCTSIMPSLGLATPRAAVDLYAPMTGNYPLTGTRHIPKLSWTPRNLSAGVVQCIWYSGQDASNYVALLATGSTEVKVEKCVAGVSEYTTFTGTFVEDTTYVLDVGFLEDNTMSLKVDSVEAQVNDSTTVAPVFGTTQWLGSKAGTLHMSGSLKDVSITDKSITMPIPVILNYTDLGNYTETTNYED